LFVWRRPDNTPTPPGRSSTAPLRAPGLGIVDRSDQPELSGVRMLAQAAVGTLGAMADENIESAVQRLSELARSYLTDAKEFYGPDFDVGIVAAAFELTRPDGWYGVGATCSDSREWVQAALFREAMKLAESEDPRNPSKPL
jgi:hypothetical protein